MKSYPAAWSRAAWPCSSCMGGRTHGMMPWEEGGMPCPKVAGQEEVGMGGSGSSPAHRGRVVSQLCQEKVTEPIPSLYMKREGRVAWP